MGTEKETPMKVFQKLKIYDKAKFKTLIIEQNKLSEEWIRSTDSEEGFKKSWEDTAFCFDYSGDRLKKAKLWIMEKPKYFTVTNIVPQGYHSLDKDEYNTLLDDFITKNLQKISYTISKADVTLQDLVGEEISNKFYTFSHCANKSTGRAHPCDSERWLELILACVENDKYIAHDYILFFLEEDGWGEQIAFDLSLDYQYGYEVMKFAKERL